MLQGGQSAVQDDPLRNPSADALANALAPGFAMVLIVLHWVVLLVFGIMIALVLATSSWFLALIAAILLVLGGIMTLGGKVF